MIVKVLKHKKLPDTFGQLSHRQIDLTNIWPSNVPELFPKTASIETLKELNKKRSGNWKQAIDDYEMVEMDLNPIN